MLFNSVEFAVFFLLIYGLYLVLRHRQQNLMLLAASWFFYGFWSWKFLLLLIATQLVDFNLGRRVAAAPTRRRKLTLVWVSVAVNMGSLAFFKYFNFFAENMHDLLGFFGVQASMTTLNVVLPVGISFYTIQELTYIIDVYKGRVAPAKRFSDFALFVSYFPQLVAGPIERAAHLMPQVENERRITTADMHEGGWLIFWGLYKKVFVADNLAVFVDRIYNDPSQAGGGQILLATYAFAIQIYCDFSGYSDMARGLAKLMGFHLMFNFNLPYFATSPSDFWRRWHISLSQCLRDNLYIPLGGNRHGRRREYGALMTTMAIGGLWHGAQWHFVFWGIYHGLLLIGQRVMAVATGRSVSPESRGWGSRLLSIILMFHLTCFGWMLFRAESMHDVGLMLSRIFGGWSRVSLTSELARVCALSVLLVLMEVVQYLRNDRLTILRWPVWLRILLYAVMYFSLTIGAPDGGRLFIYFQF